MVGVVAIGTGWAGSSRAGAAAPAATQAEFHVGVALVPLAVSVFDEAGEPVRDLPMAAFAVFDEGRPQRVTMFRVASENALDLVLGLDSSLSTAIRWKLEQQAAARFLQRVLRPGDRAAVFAFAEQVTELVGFTGELRRLQAALRRARLGSGTSLFDAVDLAAQALAAGDPGRRRAIVLVTDAGETTSRSSFEQARDAVLQAGALLYTVLVRPVESESGRNTAGEHALQTIAALTGGALYPVESSADFDRVFDRIDRELRTQYLLGYYPDPPPAAGSYHHVEVRLAPGYGRHDWTVRARSLYYFPSASRP